MIKCSDAELSRKRQLRQINVEPEASIPRINEFAHNSASVYDVEQEELAEETEILVTECMSNKPQNFQDKEEDNSGHSLSSSDDDQVADNVDSQPKDIVSFLRRWAVEKNITYESIDSLLQTLKYKLPELPGSARARLATPCVVATDHLSSGQYFHSGLKRSISTLLDRMQPLSGVACQVSFNVDGLPLFKSIGKEFWCIRVELHHPLHRRDNSICLVVAFCGASKPLLDEFVQPSMEELSEVLNTGIWQSSKRYSVSLRALICDAPARVFLEAVKMHNARSGSQKCTLEGIYVDA